MRVTDRLYEAGVADDYTPATDLVFSMLALTLLLLAIFGAGSHVTQRANDRISGKLVAAEKQIEGLTNPALPSPSQENPLTGRLRKLQQQYDDKARQYEKISDELKAAQNLAQNEVRLPPITGENFGTFLAADNRIAPRIISEVARNLASIRAQVSERSLNEVVIQVQTGYVPGGIASRVPDEEGLDTILVGSALQRGLWTTPLPPACVVIEPMGSLRASGLVDRTVMPGAGRFLETLRVNDSVMDGDALRQRMARLAPADRRILVSVRRVDGSPCSSELLWQALDRM